MFPVSLYPKITYLTADDIAPSNWDPAAYRDWISLGRLGGSHVTVDGT